MARAGTFRKTLRGYTAFHPSPLPPDPPVALDGAMQLLLSDADADRALGGLNTVLGRKNHYGSRSRRGTEVAAIIYTLMESAKLAGISPRDYLRAITELAIRSPGAVLTPGSFKASLPPKPA